MNVDSCIRFPVVWTFSPKNLSHERSSIRRDGGLLPPSGTDAAVLTEICGEKKMLYLVRCFDPYMYQASLHYSRPELRRGQVYRARRDPIDRAALVCCISH